MLRKFSFYSFYLLTSVLYFLCLKVKSHVLMCHNRKNKAFSRIFLVSVDLKDEYGRNATNPVEEARERLKDLELNIERRYLKAPLGTNAHINLNTITARITKNSARAKEYEKEQEKLNAVSHEIISY